MQLVPRDVIRQPCRVFHLIHHRLAVFVFTKSELLFLEPVGIAGGFWQEWRLIGGRDFYAVFVPIDIDVMDHFHAIGQSFDLTGHGKPPIGLVVHLPSDPGNQAIWHQFADEADPSIRTSFHIKSEIDLRKSAATGHSDPFHQRVIKIKCHQTDERFAIAHVEFEPSRHFRLEQLGINRV